MAPFVRLSDFRFTEVVSFQLETGLIRFDQETINNRIAEVESVAESSKYSKQKSVLKTELMAFLHSLEGKKGLDDASPTDIRMFLAYKDLRGLTTIHNVKCSFRGKSGGYGCDCPVRRSFGSMDSLIGQLRAIFRDYGRGKDWSDILGLGNPAAAPIIKSYLRATKLEQSASGVTPRQATPLFADKLSAVSRHISYKLSNPNITWKQRFVLQRDRAFFHTLAFSGDRSGDLGNLMSDQIFWLPEDQGVCLCLHKGKSISLADPRTIILRRAIDPQFCPVVSLLSYLEACREENPGLRVGYVFRPWDTVKNEVSEKPLSSAVVNARLKGYLQSVNLWEGETPHGTRSAVALTLSWLGLDKEGVKAHVGWKSDKMYYHYTRGNAAIQKHSNATVLSRCPLDESLKDKINLYRGATSGHKVVN